METTRIVKEISLEEFKEIIFKYASHIIINPHALDHVSDGQRRIFNTEELIHPLLKENPVRVGLQSNGRFAVFYRRNYGFLRIIFEIKTFELEITTFLNSDTVPNLKRL